MGPIDSSLNVSCNHILGFFLYYSSLCSSFSSPSSSSSSSSPTSVLTLLFFLCNNFVLKEEKPILRKPTEICARHKRKITRIFLKDNISFLLKLTILLSTNG